MKITQRTVSLMVLFIFLFVVGSIIAVRTVAYLEAGFELKGFLVQVIAYIVALTGWLTLFIYSYLKGDFKDIEGPKYDLLEREEKLIEADKKAGRY
jgi:FtsH-binding integral membrane protein